LSVAIVVSPYVVGKGVNEFDQLSPAIAILNGNTMADLQAIHGNSTFQSLPAGLLDPPTQLTRQSLLLTGSLIPKSSRPLLKRTFGVDVSGTCADVGASTAPSSCAVVGATDAGEGDCCTLRCAAACANASALGMSGIRLLL